MIKFVDVSKAYPKIDALQHINFEIPEGEFVFLIGPSGSGKSTIIKLLIKEEEPTYGNIYFYDTAITELKGKRIAQLRREIGVVFQDFKLLPYKNLYENIAFPLEVSGKNRQDIKETVTYILDLVGLSHRAEAFPDKISGGEQQRIAIARAIANNPKILIADEPTGNLDAKSAQSIVDLLAQINDWGTTVIMATHGTNIVDTLQRRTIKIEHGKIVSDNKTTQASDLPKTEKIVQKEKTVKSGKKTKEHKDITKHKTQKPPTTGKKINEKEFDIVFTTKSKLPSNPETKKKVNTEPAAKKSKKTKPSKKKTPKEK